MRSFGTGSLPAAVQCGHATTTHESHEEEGHDDEACYETGREAGHETCGRETGRDAEEGAGRREARDEAPCEGRIDEPG